MNVKTTAIMLEHLAITLRSLELLQVEATEAKLKANTEEEEIIASVKYDIFYEGLEIVKKKVKEIIEEVY